MPPVILGPRCNRRVTCAPTPSNDRSESAIAVNPTNPYNMIGAAKRFTDPMTYAFSLGVSYTFDAGLSWNDVTLTLPPGAAGTSDPAVAWDDLGNAYLIGLPFEPGTATDEVGPILGMVAYKSTDGGRTWGPPDMIHMSAGDDKQWATGDMNPASPHHGNVYAAWDDASTGGGLAFARTLDHGATWIGMGGQPAGAPITNQMFFPEVNVASNGAVYIFGLGNDGGQLAIKFMKSTDGGQSFSTPAIVASPITSVPGQLPDGTFRLETLPTGCCGSGDHIVCAWPDYREGAGVGARIYYARSNNGGNSWQSSASGDPLLAGTVASVPGQHDFMPQIVSTPSGEIGCAFYEFGPKSGGTTPLIDVVLAVSTDNGHTFPNRATVTDEPWDPATDAPWAHGNPNITFIGDYFGLDASRLGFFPLWTDTRTGTQELFTSRLAVHPTDVFIRDSSSDTGTIVPSPGFHWEAPDLIVRRQPDGNVTFVNQDLLHDGVTNHYGYGRVTNIGPSTARNAQLAVTVGNWPAVGGLPGTEFRYPQDWYRDDQPPGMHLFLGESPAIDITSGSGPQILGPILWPAAQIPDPTMWHPCLLAEVRSDNDDSPGGTLICDIDADPNPCVYGSYFWGNNDVCQRNLSYASVAAAKAAYIEFPFLVGSYWSRNEFLEVLVEKGRELADVPMKLAMEHVHLPWLRTVDEHNGKTTESVEGKTLAELSRVLEVQREAVLAGSQRPAIATVTASEVLLVDGDRVTVQEESFEMHEVAVPPGTTWRPGLPLAPQPVAHVVLHGAEKTNHGWSLTRQRASVGLSIRPGDMRRMTLAFSIPEHLEPGKPTLVRIYQRDQRKVITGGVFLQIETHKS